MNPAFLRALPPPSGPLAVITRSLQLAASSYAKASPRRRVIQSLHRTEQDTLHRMLNAVETDSYVRPHRHLDPPKAECFVVIAGALAFFTFENDGRIQSVHHLVAGGETFGIDLEPGIFHTLVALVSDTVIFEVKDGPYAPATDKTFAPWAPAEEEPAVPAYQQWLRDEAAARGIR